MAANYGKRLGKLSLAILENFVEGALGEKFVDELRAPTDRELAIAEALEKTEALFITTYEDKELSKALFIDLKQADRPVLKEAVGTFFDHPTDMGLRGALQEILFTEFRNYISTERIHQAVGFYLKLLTKELMLADETFRDNMAALGAYEGSQAEKRSAELLEKIASQTTQGQNAAQAVFRSLHQLPQAPADFTGRDKLTEQLVADFKGSQGATISGLTGMGGIGKTALGLVVAHKIAGDYPDAQIFLDLKGTTAPLSAVEIMRHVILSFEPGMDLRALDEANMAAAYRSVLHGKKVLLFFDNARAAEQIAPLQPPGACALLVTSRWNFSLPGLQVRRVDVMQPEDAAKFLRTLCPRIGDKAPQLAQACAYLPLALRIAGSFLGVNPAWTVEKYLEKLHDSKQRLTTLGQSREGAGLAAEPDLLATFELSYDQLTEEDQKRWRTLGVFPASFDAAAAQAMWDVDEDGTINLLDLLCRYSLLEFDETSSRYSLHDLLREYALAKMEAGEERNARIVHALYYSDVLFDINQIYVQGGKNILLCLRLYDAEWLNIEAGQRISALYAEEDREAAQACNRYAWQGAINGLRLMPKDQIRWIENGQKASGVLKNEEAEAAHLGNLGNAYAALGETRKALEFFEQNLAITREISDRRGEGAALGNLGNAYAALGDARRAIEFYEQALVISREIGDRGGESNALGNLGIAYKNLGEVNKAIELYEKQLVIAREIGDRRGEGNTLGNLGNAYAALGDARRAIEFYEQALMISREIGNRRGEALGSWNLGVAYEKQGELGKAIHLMQIRVDYEREIGHPNAEERAAFVEELRKKLNDSRSA